MIAPFPIPQVPSVIDPITSSMAGMDLQQAWNSKGMSDPYEIGFGIKNYSSSEPAITGDTSETIKDNSQSDPVEAFDEASETDDISEITGGIVTGSAIGTLNYALLEAANGDVKAVVPVAVPMDVAIVAGAQVLGVSMDAAELEVETKQTLARNIISGQNLIYDSVSNLVKAWWDGVKILFPRDTITAIQNGLEELNIPVNKEVSASATSDLINFTVYTGSGHSSSAYDIYLKEYYYYGVDATYAHYKTNGKIVITGVSKTSGVCGYELVVTTNTQTGEVTEDIVSHNSQVSYVYDGKTVYYGAISTEIDPLHYSGPTPVSYQNIANKFQEVSWTCVYGNIIPAGEYREGTQQSVADSYTAQTVPSDGGIAKSADSTIDVVPVNIPDSMTNTIGSTINPISQTDDNTVSDLPFPPIPLPIPDEGISNPDVPLTDATVIDAALVDALVDSLATTLDPHPPQSSGLIPFPFMPGVPEDPDDPSAGSQYPSIVPASGSGFIHVYNPTPAEFVSFGNWLWVTYADTAIDKIWNNPFDGVLGAHELYATPSNDGTDNIRSGFLVCPTTAALVRQRYTEIDCGSIVIPEFYGNYLDYSPYSQAYVYLPFIGIQEVSIDDFVGHAINVRYRVDAYNGSCIAMIYVAKQGYRNLCYQFAGNCAVEVPLAGGSQAAIKAGMMQAEAYATAGVQSAGLTGIAQALGGLAGGLAHGGLAGALGGLASGAISGLANYGAAKINAGATREAARVANKSSVQHSGTFGASHGAMGLKIPFVMIRNPIQVKVVNYNEDYGFPAHKRVVIGGCSGYLRVKEVNVISAHATNEEKIAIEEALKAGVFVT